MSGLQDKSVLYFCPKFFNYDQEIKRSLEELGAKVTWFDDRPSNSFISKLLIRVNKGLLNRKISRYYKNILKKLQTRGLKFDYILFVNPEAVSCKILTQIRDEYKSSKFILYMWDSIKNRKQNQELLPLFDAKFTFDPKDALQYDMVLRPLFYIDAYKSRDDSRIYDLLFIGTAHSDRYIFVQKIVQSFGRELKSKLHFYLGSRKLFWLKKISEASFKSVQYRDVSFTSLSHEQNAALIGQSNAVLDINHPKQCGLTMRTFETLGAQRKLITTNADVLNYDFYNPKNILVIDRASPVVDKAFIEGLFEPTDEKTLFKYSIQGWAYDIFELK